MCIYQYKIKLNITNSDTLALFNLYKQELRFIKVIKTPEILKKMLEHLR